MAPLSATRTVAKLADPAAVDALLAPLPSPLLIRASLINASGQRHMAQYDAGAGVMHYVAANGVNAVRLDGEGRVFYTRNGIPRIKRYLDESSGLPMQDVWTDIESLRSWHDERLGYPTQKPLTLLERIISASSNDGDTVLDPFCGCGTAVHAAEKLKRQWIGIDITHLAISLIEKRLRDAFPGIKFDVHGTPKDYEGARNLAERDKYQFQWWACSLVNAQPYQGKKKGADSGIDGLIFFQDEKDAVPKKIIVSVKGGENIGVTMIKDLIATCSVAASRNGSVVAQWVEHRGRRLYRSRHTAHKNSARAVEGLFSRRCKAYSRKGWRIFHGRPTGFVVNTPTA